MGFMRLQTRLGLWYLVETLDGGEVLSADLCDCTLNPGDTLTPDSPRWQELTEELADWVGAEPDCWLAVECRRCWGARWTAPGYLDATDWVLAESEGLATAAATEQYGDEDDYEIETPW